MIVKHTVQVTEKDDGFTYRQNRKFCSNQAAEAMHRKELWHATESTSET